MFFNGIYNPPLVQVGPYLVGIFFGYFSFHYDKKVKIHVGLMAIGWLTSTILFVLLMFNYYEMENVNPWLRLGFANTANVLWAFVLLWVCFVSVSEWRGKSISAKTI